jgi:hypothetical protein
LISDRHPGERTVKNWFAGTSGDHLVSLVQNSDETLAVFLVLADRKPVLAASQILDMRDKLAEAVEQVDLILKREDFEH